MIIGISGSQGQGKSTIISSLMELGHNVVPIKTSRSILKEWNLSLNTVNKYPELTKQFQEKIIEKHIEIINSYANDELYFMERTFADIFTYCLFQLGSFNEYNEWLNDYYQRCLDGQKKMKHIFFISGRTINMEDDGVRSVNKHFVQAVDMQLEHCLNKMANDLESPNQIIKVNSPDHEERMDTILNNIRNL